MPCSMPVSPSSMPLLSCSMLVSPSPSPSSHPHHRWITGHSYIVYGPLSNGATTVTFDSVPTYPNAGRYWYSNRIDSPALHIHQTLTSFPFLPLPSPSFPFLPLRYPSFRPWKMRAGMWSTASRSRSFIRRPRRSAL